MKEIITVPYKNYEYRTEEGEPLYTQEELDFAVEEARQNAILEEEMANETLGRHY